MNVPPSKKAELTVVGGGAGCVHHRHSLPEAAGQNASEVTVTADAADANGLVSVVTSAAKLYIPLAELVDLDAERARLAKEIEKAEKYLAGIEKKLSNGESLSPRLRRPLSSVSGTTWRRPVH